MPPKWLLLAGVGACACACATAANVTLAGGSNAAFHKTAIALYAVHARVTEETLVDFEQVWSNREVFCRVVVVAGGRETGPCSSYRTRAPLQFGFVEQYPSVALLGESAQPVPHLPLSTHYVAVVANLGFPRSFRSLSLSKLTMARMFRGCNPFALPNTCQPGSITSWTDAAVLAGQSQQMVDNLQALPAEIRLLVHREDLETSATWTLRSALALFEPTVFEQHVGSANVFSWNSVKAERLTVVQAMHDVAMHPGAMTYVPSDLLPQLLEVAPNVHVLGVDNVFPDDNAVQGATYVALERWRQSINGTNTLFTSSRRLNLLPEAVMQADAQAWPLISQTFLIVSPSLPTTAKCWEKNAMFRYLAWVYLDDETPFIMRQNNLLPVPDATYVSDLVADLDATVFPTTTTSNEVCTSLGAGNEELGVPRVDFIVPSEFLNMASRTKNVYIDEVRSFGQAGLGAVDFSVSTFESVSEAYAKGKAVQDAPVVMMVPFFAYDMVPYYGSTTTAGAAAGFRKEDWVFINLAAVPLKVVFNLPGVTDLSLSQDQLGQILTGNVSMWSDLNASFPNAPIRVVHAKRDSWSEVLWLIVNAGHVPHIYVPPPEALNSTLSHDAVLLDVLDTPFSVGVVMGHVSIPVPEAKFASYKNGAQPTWENVQACGQDTWHTPPTSWFELVDSEAPNCYPWAVPLNLVFTSARIPSTCERRFGASTPTSAPQRGGFIQSSNLGRSQMEEAVEFAFWFLGLAQNTPKADDLFLGARDVQFSPQRRFQRARAGLPQEKQGHARDPSALMLGHDMVPMFDFVVFVQISLDQSMAGVHGRSTQLELEGVRPIAVVPLDMLAGLACPAYEYALFDENLDHVPDALYIAFVSIMAISVFGFFLLAVWVVHNRNMRIINHSSPVFLLLVLLGATVGQFTILAMSYQDNSGAFTRGFGFDEARLASLDSACRSQPWLFTTGFALVFGSLFIKTWRIVRIFNHKGARALKLTDAYLIAFPLGLAMMFIVMNIGWALSWQHLQWDRFPTTVSETDVRIEMSTGLCTVAAGDPWMAMLPQLVLIGVMLVAGIRISWLARGLPSQFQESSWIAAAIVMWAQNFTIAVPVIYLVSGDATATYLVKALVIILNNLSVVGLIFGPKVFAVYVYKQQSAVKTHSSSSKEAEGGGAAAKASYSKNKSGTGLGTSFGAVSVSKARSREALSGPSLASLVDATFENSRGGFLRTGKVAMSTKNMSKATLTSVRDITANAGRGGGGGMDGEMSKVLSEAALRRRLKRYLASIQATENIDFIEACEAFATATSVEERVALGTDIMKTFVVSTGCKQVNLKSETREDLLAAFKSRNVELYLCKPDFFARALNEVIMDIKQSAAFAAFMKDASSGGVGGDSEVGNDSEASLS